MKTTRHFGIYGVWRHEGKLVLVRKSRGPYTGQLDLPGGTPELGETAKRLSAVSSSRKPASTCSASETGAHSPSIWDPTAEDAQSTSTTRAGLLR